MKHERPNERSGGDTVGRTGLGRLLHAWREPVLQETRANLARSWTRLPAAYRTPRQMLGRQGNGCGATIGAMPRCDFACRGCYLGHGANAVPPQSVEEMKRQMRALRPTLGNAGNLQLTDGEVTLRPDAELIELVRYAQEIGLVPMLMTHGDSFRRRPGLLERLMVEGGLVELSIHVDTTQRGRRGEGYRTARTEAELNPLRDEFAAMIRRARAETGRELRAATTVTVTRDNLSGVADVMRWVVRNVDAFRMVSFQPVAQVGRTEDDLGGGVEVDALWAQIAVGVYGDPARAGLLVAGRAELGHPACNRFVHGVVATGSDGHTDFHPFLEADNRVNAQVVGEFLDRFGGITFRRDSRLERVVRILGVVAQAPMFVVGNGPGYVGQWLRRLGQGRPVRAGVELLTGRLRLRDLIVVSHHFMSRAELETPHGRERIGLCVFHVSVGDRLISMCEVNAMGIRDDYYKAIQSDARVTPSVARSAERSASSRSASAPS